MKQVGFHLRIHEAIHIAIFLDIQNMSDKDKLHNFIFGMHGWAQNELHGQKVQDLTSAIATIDSLIDF